MKKYFLFLTLIQTVFALTVYSTVLTVSNHPLGGSQFNNLEAAYNTANNGDTLILEGTSNLYTLGFNWNKPLVVIGQGYNTQKQNFQRVMIEKAGVWNNYNSIFYFSISGGSFFGINFVSNVVGNGANIVFEDCMFSSTIELSNTSTNFSFRNCIFDIDNVQCLILPASPAVSTVSLINCLFDGAINGQSNSFNTLLIDHCIFLQNNGESLLDLTNASISNSIFMNFTIIANPGTNGCGFLNNIARLGATLPPTGNNGSGNLSSTNPNFTAFALGNLYNSSQDFHLQGGSPAIGTASDATDIGIHGGYSSFSEQGEPLITPIIRSMSIINTTVQPNGTLNIQINASKPDDN